MALQVVGYFLASCIGLSLGLLGGGGSVLALPILVYVMQVPPKAAIAMTLVIVGAVSLIGVIPHWRRGNVNLPKALIFGSATMVGAFGGAKLATLPLVTETFQLILFAVLMLVAAIFMIRKAQQRPQLSSTEDPDLATYPAPICKYCWLWLLTEGIAIGVLTGLVGVGGGFAIVPALVLLGKLPMKEAIGTSLLIIAFNSVAGFLGYFGQVSLDYHLMVSFTFFAALGILLGSHLSSFVDAKNLQKGFAYFLMAISAFILFQQRDTFRSSKANSYLPEISSQVLLQKAQ
ncbi:sulfite exporter TauE/SafE family protein [Synechocystis sp. CACIAM 05]|uniref:sulfite exporter TauE/SafE family protein n=1 Tax=Synechocystis sp. CACIAM 05 TaxID=1933929 RepID=UPI00138E5941|nr:sulfite exporter TauE/SafE family protein [Synechocystis sp. CACIAM 05]QHU99863.1 permease [Synechocystis sp. CACIAM 05]